MIDVQRVLALSEKPRPGQRDDLPSTTVEALLILSDLGHTDARLARPIGWSLAACRGAMAAAEDSAEAVCVRCPIRQECSTALHAGAPEEVQAWRARANWGSANR
ncbi:hypothetical protein [Streptomyces erythrochromogenes]|uniref:hypothetical protein n=1 Tax=Streptomyces erythrochromogenes TaxID=285574 RepID=UPI00368139D0